MRVAKHRIDVTNSASSSPSAWFL